MEFTAYLETKEDYHASDVIAAFHMMLELGQKALEEKGLINYADIIRDIRNSEPTIERE